jgi:hypothetical protein
MTAIEVNQLVREPGHLSPNMAKKRSTPNWSAPYSTFLIRTESQMHV